MLPLAQAMAEPMSSAMVRGSGGVALPGNAIGVWYADQYQASPRRLVPNAAASVSASKNLFSVPFHQFANAAAWSKVNATCVDYASGNDSSLAGTGNWFLSAGNYDAVPAGTYTIVAEVARNGGTDQVFALSKDATATRSSVKTAGASFVRHSYTFTLASPLSVNNFCLCSSDGATAANLLIRSLAVYPGSSDLGEPQLAGHCYLGGSHYASQPGVAGSEIDISAGGWGSIQFQDAISVSGGFTQVACVKATGVVSFNTILSKIQNFGEFSTTLQQNSYVAYYLGGSISGNPAGLWKLSDKGYHVFTFRANGTEKELWIDDCKLHYDAASLASFSLQDLNLGLLASAYGSALKVNSIACWNRALTDSELAAARAVLEARAVGNGLTVSPIRVVGFEGDSITGADGSTYAYLYGDSATVPFVGRNWAVAFATMDSGANSLTARQPVVNAAVPANKNGRKFILAVLIGANDLAGWPGATDTIAANAWADRIFQIADAYRAAGWELGLWTVLPKGDSATHNTRRAVANARIRAAVGVHCDFVLDIDTDAIMGSNTSYADNPTYWTDAVHPSQIGRQRMADLAKPIIDAR